MNVSRRPAPGRRDFLCLGGERAAFERIMSALMALQAPPRRESLAARHAVARAIAVQVEVGIVAYIGSAVQGPRVSIAGGLSANHQRILALILKTYRPMVAFGMTGELDGEPEGPIVLEWVPEEVPGHERLAAVDMLIDFLVSHGHARAEAEALVQ